MRTRLLLQAITIIIFIVVAIGCRSARTNRRHYPPYSTGTNLPPGQAKKIYGQRSARVFAPGQQKKYGNDDVYDNEGERKPHNKYKNGRGRKWDD